MKRFYHLILSGLLLCLAAGVSAQPLSVSVGDANGAIGSQVCVDLTGGNWDNISAFSFSLIFDPAVLQYEDDQTSGSILSTAINFNSPSSTPNAVRTVWNLFFATEGYTDVGPFTVGTVCFTVLQETETDITIEGMPVPISFNRPDNSEQDNVVVSGGTINGGSGGGATCSDGMQNGSETGIDCGGPDCADCLPDPTCNDNVQNGNETGVDCGGPDCAPCDTGNTCGDNVQNGMETGIDCGGPDCAPCGGSEGGPDLTCGDGTTNFVLCLGDACNVDQNGPVCLDITAGNLTDISAFQADIDFQNGQLFYQSISTDPSLSNNIVVNVVNAGKIRLLFFQPDQSGNTVPDATIIATVCFTNQNAGVTNLSFSTMTARDNNGNAVPIEGNGGTVNDCSGEVPTCTDGMQNGNETGVDCGGPDCAACPTTPTCTDGMQNGNETGVDCGGPDCTPCNTTGGPDLDCGDGTSNLTLCFGDACNIPVNGTACLDVTVGNFTDVTAFQADIISNAGQLTFLSWTSAGALSNNIIANTSTGVPRLLFFQPDQSGNTVADGTIIGTVCFTNLTTNPAVAQLSNLTARDNDGNALNISGSTGSVNDCGTTVTPTCTDGMQNGNETGIDCGGPDCAACPTTPTCTDGILNGSETGVDCGGPDCTPCNTTGGPDLDCGMGTTDVSFCLGDVCNVPLNGTACVDLTVGNFDGITAFQADVITNANQLTFLSFTDAGALSNPIIANSNGTLRLLFFQPDQGGNTVSDGTIVGTLCFTNLNADVSSVELQNITARDDNGAALPTTSGSGTVNNCEPMGPTCTDGVMNGNETGIDCGGDCDPCPTCNDGMMNGNETGVDCGGDCMDCVTECGENTTDVEFCLGNDCGAAGAMICLPVFIGNFDDLAGFQFELTYELANLDFSEVVLGAELGAILQNSEPTPGRLVFQWNDISTAGQTLAADIPLFEVCFTVINEVPSTVTFLNPNATVRAFNELGQSLPARPGSAGIANGTGCGTTEPTCDDGVMNGSETGVDCGGPDCAACPPTCDDGVMNGQETGIDCGGPDCAPCAATCDDGIQNGQETGVDCGGPDCDACPTGGGPDTDCGMGTTDVTLCLGDVCNIGANGEACVAITVGNFTDVTAFQADIIFNTSELAFVSWTNAGTLSNPIIANNGGVGGAPRLLFFQPDQSGNTVANGTIIGTACFTNLNGGNSSEINLGSLTARDNNGAALPISGSNGFVNNCGTTGGPTCTDGMMNGLETGVDCGGPECPDCPTNDELTITVPDGSVSINETICIDVTVDGFTNITDLDFNLNFNPGHFQLVSVEATPALSGFGAGNFTATSGQVAVSYTPGTPQTLADGATLFTVCLRGLQTLDTDVGITGGAADSDGMSITVIGNDGQYNIDAGGNGDLNLSLFVGNGTGGVNQEVCVPVTTTNFNDIVGFQFATTYPADRLQFASATSTGALPGLVLSNPPGGGVIRALWADPGANPSDLPDGTVLFDACFTVLQACQTPVIIEDIAGFTIQFTDGDNEEVNPIETFGGIINNGTPCDVMPASNLILDIGNASGGVGQEVCLDLTVENFSSLTDLTFSLTYDPAIVSFSGANNFGLTSITGADVNGNTSGVITFDWDASLSAGQSIADGGVLMSLCFIIDALVATNVSFANSPITITARNGDGQNIGIIPAGGRINPDVPVIDGMTIDIGDATAAAGTSICLPLIVFDPQPLAGFQFSIIYDPAILTYTGNSNFAFTTGFLNINNSPPGVLRVAWDDPLAQQSTLPNGGTLFEICFDVLSITPTIVSIEDSPTAIEFFRNPDVIDVDLIPGLVNGTDAPMIIGADISNPSCFGDSDGFIHLNVVGGGNLTYNWSPNVSSGIDADNLAAGTYSVTVTNPATGQSDSRTYTLSTLPFNASVANVTGVSCDGAADGSITIETVGGASPFLIDWSGSLQDGRLVQTDLDGGSYSVTVTDNNGCSMSQTNINVAEPDELEVSGTPLDIEEDMSGGVIIVVEGGRPGYTYSWTGPNGYTSVAKDVENAVDAGTYCVTVTDLNMCTDVQCFAVNAALDADSDVDSGCVDEDNGSIDLSPFGGNGSYTYLWSFGGTTISMLQDVDNLAPGDYTVMITSGTASITQTIEVPVPDPIVVTGIVTNATSGNNGAITVTVTGGNPGYSYEWADGPTTQNRTGLSSGEYCVTVTDASECTATECFTVGAAAVSFTATSTRPASCSDGDDGVIRLVIANGALPFTVRIEPLGTEVVVDSNTIEVMVPPGTYDVFVVDDQGAELMTSETVGGPSAITATGNLTSDTENDGCSGMISLDIAGGTAGYTVAWSSMQSGMTISMLCAGDYVATITDQNGCTFTTETFTIGRIDEELNAVTNVACEDGTDGAIEVTISGGTGPYSFSWTRAGSTEEIADTEDLTGAGAGDYQLTVIDATGATLVRNYTIGIAAGFAVSTSVTSDYSGFDISCSDATDGEAVAIISGQGNFTYEWFLNDTTVDTDSILNDVAAGTYLLIVTSSGGCAIERMVELTGPEAVTIAAEVTAISCGSTTDGAIVATPSGGVVATYDFEWSNGSNAGLLMGLGQGTYGLTVTDANDCIAEASFVLDAPENLAFTFEPTPATEGCNGSIQIIPLSGDGPFTYNWIQLPSQGSNPLAEGLCPGEYTVEVTDANRCQTVIMIARVEDRRFPCLSAREVITPNGDGLNEAFILFCSEDETVSNNNLEIYNRWGQLVFNTVDYNCSADDGTNCFEGRTNDGAQLPAGPYYYIFNYTNEFMEERQQRGSLTIVRD